MPASDDKLLRAALYGYSMASEDYRKGMLLGFILARKGGDQYVAPAWIKAIEKFDKEEADAK